MKKFIYCFFALWLCLTNANAASSGRIVAIVEDEPITQYDLDSRKAMILLFGGGVPPQGFEGKAFDDLVKEALITEKIMSQHASKNKIKIKEEQIEEAIYDMEQKNNLPKGGFEQIFRDNRIDYPTFRQYVIGELIKSHIIRSLMGAIQVSSSEIDSAIINQSSLDFETDILVASIDLADLSKKEMLKKWSQKPINCTDVNTKDNVGDVTIEHIKDKVSKYSPRTKSIIMDTKQGAASNIYEEDGKFKTVFVCKKGFNLSDQELVQTKVFLSNKKLSQKAAHFFRELRRKARVQVIE